MPDKEIDIYLALYKTDFADLIDGLTDTIEQSDEIRTKSQCVSFLRQIADYARNFVKDKEFHCGIEESGGHAYNCNDCPNKCEEWYQWDKENKDENNNIYKEG